METQQHVHIYHLLDVNLCKNIRLFHRLVYFLLDTEIMLLFKYTSVIFVQNFTLITH